MDAVPVEMRAVFRQIADAFEPDFEIWIRKEDFGRRVTAAIVNRSTNVAATVSVLKPGNAIRTSVSSDDIAKIREHLRSPASDDLTLP